MRIFIEHAHVPMHIYGFVTEPSVGFYKTEHDRCGANHGDTRARLQMYKEVTFMVYACECLYIYTRVDIKFICIHTPDMLGLLFGSASW